MCRLVFVALFACITAITLVPGSARANKHGNSIFHSTQREISTHYYGQYWDAMNARRAQRSEPEERRWRNWLYTMRKKTHGLTAKQTLKVVNTQVNDAITYVEDAREYWAMPSETMGSWRADCEDYAIIKFFTLEELGFNGADMRVVITKDMRRPSVLHSILTIRLNDIVYALDNAGSVKTEDEASYFVPRISMNLRGMWQHQTGSSFKPFSWKFGE